jgi:hypothetical protein
LRHDIGQTLDRLGFGHAEVFEKALAVLHADKLLTKSGAAYLRELHRELQEEMLRGRRGEIELAQHLIERARRILNRKPGAAAREVAETVVRIAESAQARTGLPVSNRRSDPGGKTPGYLSDVVYGAVIGAVLGGMVGESVGGVFVGVYLGAAAGAVVYLSDSSAPGSGSQGGQEGSGDAGADAGGGDAGGGDACFPAGTPVLMADGSARPIQMIQVGDLVASRKVETGQEGLQLVTRVFRHNVKSTLRLEFCDGNGLTTTREHRFFVPGEGFVAAGRLSEGSAIATWRGGERHVTGKVGQGESAIVYNLEIANFNTYFVGEKALLVHNLKKQGPPEGE